MYDNPYASTSKSFSGPTRTLNRYSPAPKPMPITEIPSDLPTGYLAGAPVAVINRVAQEQANPYVAPEPIVQALRQKSLNPDGIRRNANTFRGTTNAPVAPEGKTNPSGANRSAQVTSQV